MLKNMNTGRVASRVNLFVIRQKANGAYWCCSTEHGSGWNPGEPKQAFSRSELTKQIRLLIEQGWFTDLEILQLAVEAGPQLGTVGMGYCGGQAESYRPPA